mmetsp:Transcript_10761/g.32937  ORF Transcript_10761/g.32937 Transcript_10761/m.32937 type:complete len:92 (+) Transcript_10761:254-529(+)
MELPKNDPITFDEESRFPRRSALVAAILVCIGFTLVIAGLGVGLKQPEKAIYILIVGVLCLAPGLWALAVMYRAHAGERGYFFNQANMFDK